MTEVRSQNAVRESVLTLLSEDEIARVTIAEATCLLDGDEYLDLEHLAHGVLRVTGATAPMADVLPRKAVRDRTWRKILAQLEPLRTAVHPPYGGVRS
ncbi:MAG TPA: hypothetical protein VFG53_07180 [Anaeromyxobacter sp.]|nr:hypothetical protein [Anaeromyxobacter sp.]